MGTAGMGTAGIRVKSGQAVHGRGGVEGRKPSLLSLRFLSPGPSGQYYVPDTLLMFTELICRKNPDLCLVHDKHHAYFALTLTMYLGDMRTTTLAHGRE